MKLARTRRVDEFHAGFILLNFAGISLLAVRSAELREWAFLGINVLTAAFWLGVLALKAQAHRGRARPAIAPPEPAT